MDSHGCNGILNFKLHHATGRACPLTHQIPRMLVAARTLAVLALVTAGILAAGCTRDRYRFRADKGSYQILQEKSATRPWELPTSYTIDADPRSRLFDPTDPNDPMLPQAGPQLYSYELPPLRDAQQTALPAEEIATPTESQSPPPPPEPSEPASPEAAGIPQDAEVPQETSEPADNSGSDNRDAEASPPALSPAEPALLPPSGSAIRPASAALPIAADDENTPADDATEPQDKPETEDSSKAEDQVAAEDISYDELSEDLTIQPIPAEYWDTLPRSCLSRMLEFESVRVEYRRTYGSDPPAALRDDARKLTFDNIVELGFLNSRSYQTDKETLYRAALQLTLRRYDYMTKFTPFGNGSAVDFDHGRTNNVTSNRLGIPTTLQADRMVALGGTVVTQFANDVVLQFDGAGVVSRNVNSALVLDFLQSIYQRDILLEPLIQSERNVVYAARRFTRSRRETYVSFVRSYYRLLSRYRKIELDSQNYFALARQLQEEFAVVDSGFSGPGALSRVQIDQIEQNMLTSRRALIESCNGTSGIDRGLDELNLTLGLPTETPINLDLTELERLTIRDDTEVRGEQIRRTQLRLERQLQLEQPDREEILSASIVLSEFLIEWLDLRRQLEEEATATSDLRLLRARLRIDEAYEALDRSQALLTEMINQDPPTAPVNIFRGTVNVVTARVELIARMLQLTDLMSEAAPERAQVLARFRRAKAVTEAVAESVAEALRGQGQQDLGMLQTQAENTLQDLQAIEPAARKMAGMAAQRADLATEIMAITMLAEQLSANTTQMIAELDGLPAIDISVDDAMITALVQRLELMNQRGLLADDWRRIKLTADELKSRLNFNLRQTLATSNTNTGGTRTSFDTTSTELGMSLDLPLNRRQQRNDFRASLIDYQQGRRNLMALEDNIKLDVRQDLRQLDLNRVQYGIDIVSAALASERVYSTRLELSLGLANITARDFLEALAAYRRNLSNVANDRFNYIQQRAQLALDLELLVLNENGLWAELDNRGYQPEANPIYPFNAGPTYGDLPLNRVWPSQRIKRLLSAPPPGYMPGHVIWSDDAETIAPPETDASALPETAPPPVPEALPVPPPAEGDADTQ